MKPNDKSAAPAEPNQKTDSWIEEVQRQVSSLRYGVVQIVVHNSQVVQIERTERIRLDRGAAE